MTVLDKDTIGKRCIAAALALCFAHILTIAGTEYQAYAATHKSLFDYFPSIYFGKFFLVNYSIFLAPVVILLLARNVCPVVGIYAIPVLIIFVLRMYDVWQFYWFGINSMAVQKGDGLNFFTILFETVSVGLAALALLIVLSIKLINGVERAWRR